MKKITLLFMSVMAFTFCAYAQPDTPISVNLDPTATWLGFANVYETPANGGGFAFASGWGVGDLKSVIDGAGGTVTVQPNFNTWNPGDAFWVVGGVANKYFEANTFVEFNGDPAYLNREITFTGNISSYTFTSPDYVKDAILKVFPADFSSVKEYRFPISGTGDFTIIYPESAIEPADAVVQVGFQVFGPIADPANEAALGSIVAQPQTLGINDFELADFSVYPNPSNNVWSIKSNNQTINNIQVFDVLGKQVMNVKPNNTDVELNASVLPKGLYFAKITTEFGSNSIKLIKN